MAKFEEEKKDQNPETNKPPKKEGFWKRTWKRFGRDIRDVAIGVVIGGLTTAAVFTARSSGAETSTTEETEDQNETDSYDGDNDTLEVSDE